MINSALETQTYGSRSNLHPPSRPVHFSQIIKQSTDTSAFSTDTHRSPLPAAIAAPAHTIYPTVQISPLCSLAHCAVGFQQGSGYCSYFRLLSASDLQSLSYATIWHALRFTEDQRKEKCSKAALMSPVISHSKTMARFEPLFQSRVASKS